MPRPEAGQRHHHRRRRAGAGVHRRRRREEEHLRRPRHPVQLAPRQAGLRQLSPRLQPRHASRERHPGVAADGQVQRLRRLPRRRDPHVPGVVPRQPGVHQGRRQGAALRRLPRRAQHRPAGDRRVPQPADGACAPSCHEDAEETYLDSYHGKAYTPRLGQDRRVQRLPRRPPHPSGLRPGQHRLQARTSSRPAPSATRGPTRTSPTSARTSIRRTRARPGRSGSSGSPTSCSSPWCSPSPPSTPPCTSTAAPKRACTHAAKHRDHIGDTRIEFQRFNVFHRWMHFLVIVSFTVLVFTGMPLKYQDTAVGAVVHGPVRRRHGGRHLPPARGHRHGGLLDGGDGLHGRSWSSAAAARTCAARVP